MANISHKNITEADLHEPKGASAASVDTVYVADGAGSGAFAQAPYKYSLTPKLEDLSTASSTYVSVPVAGTITKIYSNIDKAITVADADLTFFINGTPITNSTITVAFSGSAPGDQDSSTPSAANTVVAGDIITVTSDGGSTTTCPTTLTLLIEVP